MPAIGSLVVGDFVLRVKAFRTGATSSPTATADYRVSSGLTPGLLAGGTAFSTASLPDGIAYSFGDPTTSGNMLKTKGAVFRSKGEWYRLAFKCETTPDHFDVTAFKFRIGEMVPRDAWDEHYLYD